MAVKDGYFRFGDSSARNFANIFADFEKEFPLIKKNSSIVLDAKPEANMKTWTKAKDYTLKLTESGFADFQYFGEHKEWFKTSKEILNSIVLIVKWYGYCIDANGKRDYGLLKEYRAWIRNKIQRQYWQHSYIRKVFKCFLTNLALIIKILLIYCAKYFQIQRRKMMLFS
jgi:hypothetical protein